MLLKTLSTQLPKPAAASAVLVEADDQPLTVLQQVPTREVVDIREQEQVPIGTPQKKNERPSVELVPEGVTARAAELSMSWVSLFGPNVDLSHPSVQADLLHLIGLPKEMAEQQQKTHEEVLLSSVHHSLRSLVGLNALMSHVKELSAISNNYQKEKEEMEKKLNEKSSVVDKLTEHFTRQFRKLLSERKAAEDTLEKKEKEWEAQEAELKKQLDEFKAEAASLRNSLDEVKTKRGNLLKQGNLYKRIIKPQYDLDEEEYVLVTDL